MSYYVLCHHGSIYAAMLLHGDVYVCRLCCVMLCVCMCIKNIDRYTIYIYMCVRYVRSRIL